jgi:hypothetical protein
MTYTPVEWVALILIVVSVVKMLFLLFNPKAWMNFVKGFYSLKSFAQLIALILAGIVLYYLIQGGITIVDILAVTTFIALLVIVGLVSEIDLLLKRYDSLVKQGKLWKRYWFYTLLWIILLIWGVREIFM